MEHGCERIDADSYGLDQALRATDEQEPFTLNAIA
jgi:hypothetical protein